MNNITLSFGKRIRNLRIAKSISQEKLAELSGLHATYIGQIERGEKSPTIESIYKISVGLNISISKLLDNMNDISDSDKEDWATKIYNEIISLPDPKKEKIYKIICKMINL